MNTNSNSGSLAGKLLTWFLVALLAIAALKMAFWVLGIALALGGFLLVHVVPLLLIGWLVVKLVRWLGRSDGYHPA